MHAAAFVGHTVGDPLKDTSAPALNIVMKLMAIISICLALSLSSAHGNHLGHFLPLSPPPSTPHTQTQTHRHTPGLRFTTYFGKFWFFGVLNV